MVTYTTPARALHGRLSASSALSAIATGGVWDRPLTRKGPQATPGAFGATPPHRQLPSVVVPDNGEDGDPSGPDTAFFAFPLIYFYADDDPNGIGRQAIESAFGVARTLLHHWTFTTSSSTGVEVTVIGRLGIRTDPTDDTRLMDYLRLQADGLWTGAR